MFNFSHLLFFIIVALLSSNTAFSAKVDPTRPFDHTGLNSVTPEGKELVLESIIYGEGVHTVVVSGRILKINDFIGEYQLTKINTQSVVLDNGTKQVELNIFKEHLVKPSVTQ